MAREAVRKSLVLLKNGKNANDSVLPLSKKLSKILVAGSHADNLGYQCGGWTIAWQGFSGNNYTSGMFSLTSVCVVEDLIKLMSDEVLNSITWILVNYVLEVVEKPFYKTQTEMLECNF